VRGANCAGLAAQLKALLLSKSSLFLSSNRHRLCREESARISKKIRNSSVCDEKPASCLSLKILSIPQKRTRKKIHIIFDDWQSVFT